MTVDALRFRLQGLTFLDAVSTRPAQAVELTRGPAPHLLLWNANDLTEVFRSEREMRLEPSDTLRPLVGPASLLFANGSRHTAYRQVVGPALRGTSLRSHVPVIRAIAEQAAEELTAQPSFAVPPWARRVTLRVIGHILLGDRYSPVLPRVSDLVERVLGSPWHTLCHRYLRPPAAAPSPWRSFLRERAALCEDLVRPRPTDTVPGCPILAAELAYSKPPLGRLGPEELADQLISLIFAGHETTASAISWTLYWLATRDEIRADLTAELAADPADGSSAADLPLLDAVCRESLRITPPATLAGNRTLTRHRELIGRPLAGGTTLTPCIYLAHRQPGPYPRPERFDPSRFLGRPGLGQHYLPFGGGTRRCPGADLAMMEMRMVIAAALRRVRIGRPADYAGAPFRRGPAMGPSPALTLTTRSWP